jgi:flagellar biosynthesis protein FlhA
MSTPLTLHPAVPRLRDIRIGTDVMLALAVIALLSILMLPLPPALLDIGLSVSVTLAVLVLMVSLFLETPLQFSAFPQLLLLATLLRLSLNVATTRLILSHGNEGPLAAGHVVAAFGGFLMGGDVVIGVILFAILLVVNFMVITKGSGRIAEVAARFSLDAMPGKQMAIDADLNAGLINDKIARTRRKALEEETGFYGAMDGAAKFVRGDAIAGLIITSINIAGGLGIGILRHGMGFADAVQTFTTLTVGDGLVTQIPALLVSVAAGIVVTKGGVEGRADLALTQQLGGSPQALALAASVSFALALLPGLPALPFLALAGGAGFASFTRWRQDKVQEAPVSVAAPQHAEPPVTDAMRIDGVRVELGFGLLGLASGTDQKLTEQIKALRRSIAAEMGFVLPPVRIQDNLDLGADNYIIRIKDIEAGRGEIRPEKLLAMTADGSLPLLAGEATKEPAFNLPALWIDPANREAAILRGCTIADPASVLTTHLTEILREMMAELLSYAETQKLLDDLPREHSKLVADLVPAVITIGGVQRVLQALLAERISIRDLPTILEGINEACASGARAIGGIVAVVRVRLARQICDQLAGNDGVLALITLGPEWDQRFADSLVGPAEDRQIAMAPSELGRFLQAMRDHFDRASPLAPALLCSATVRAPLQAVIERVRPATPVLAQTEIHLRARVKLLTAI